MPNRKRSTGPKAPPKLFRCHGYGNCNMVFTRSEHLARHERKHTGEKPYQCIVPGCERMFSRFDNMMQHTQTHEKNRKPSRANSTSNTMRATQQQQQQQPRTVSRTGASTRTEDNIRYNEEHNHPYMSVVESPPESSSMINSRTLPLPNTRRSSMSSYGSTSSNLPHLLNGYPSHHPSYYDTPRNRASWPLRRETAALHSSSSYPYYNPYNNDTSDPYGGRRSSVSTVSSDASLVSPMSANFPLHQHKEPEIVRRRISIDDLRLPIEDLKNIHLEEEKITYDDKKTVDITSDELEALEGFSKFHSTSVIGAPCASETSPKLFNSSSPNFASQVCAMRQRVMTSNESYQRG